MQDNDRFVDKLLDSALAQQQRAEPRAGFEGRILERVRATASAPASSRKRWVLVPVVAAATAVMIAAIYVARRPHSVTVPAPQASTTASASASSNVLTARLGTKPKPAAARTIVEPKRPVHREGKPSRRVEAHHWPSQFPTPAPLSPEEKALIQYVRETPPQVLAEPILKPDSTVQRVEVKPLEIPPLEIKPLALGPGHEEMR